MGRHRHDPVCANVLGELAQRRGRHLVAVRSSSNDRYTTIGLLDDDSNPPLTFFVRHRRKFARIGRPDEPGRARLDAKLHLAPERPFVQNKVVSKRRNDNRKDAAPVLVHHLRSTRGSIARTADRVNASRSVLFCRQKPCVDLPRNGSSGIIDHSARAPRLGAWTGLLHCITMIPGLFRSVYYN